MALLTWGDVFRVSLQNLWLTVADFMPKLIIAVVLFILGWVLASIIGKAVNHIVSALKIDKLFESAGAGDVMRRSGVRLTVGGFLGGLVRWFIIIAFFIPCFNILGLDQVNQYLGAAITGYLPRVFVAAVVLIVAAIGADFIAKVVSSSARAANVRSANMVATIVRYGIWIFAFLIAFSQLGIAPQFMQVLFMGIIGMLALAGGLAFGLGGKDFAARTLEHFRGQVSSHE